MQLDPDQRHAAIFLHPDNQALVDIASLERGTRLKRIDAAAVREMTGVNRQTLDNWRSGATPVTRTLFLEQIRTTRRYLEAAAERQRVRQGFDEREFDRLSCVLTEFTAAFAKGRFDIYNVAHILGMPVGNCRRILESQVHRTSPVFKSIYRDVEKCFKRYEGVYLAWMRADERRTGGEDAPAQRRTWLQCTLHVSHLQQCGEEMMIRTKLNVPIVGTARVEGRDGVTMHPFAQFDGYLASRDTHLRWSFERRKGEGQDDFDFTTHIGRPSDIHVTMRGLYLTTCPDDEHPAATGVVLLHRLMKSSRDPLQRDYLQVMEGSTKVLDSEQELAEAEKRWVLHGGQGQMGVDGEARM